MNFSNNFMSYGSQSSVDVIDPTPQIPPTSTTPPSERQSSARQLNAVPPTSPTAEAIARRLSRSRENSLQNHSTSSLTPNVTNQEAQAKASRRQELRSNYETEYPFASLPSMAQFGFPDTPQFKQKVQKYCDEKGLVLDRDYCFFDDLKFKFTSTILSYSATEVLKGAHFVPFNDSDNLVACMESLKENAKQYMSIHNSFPERAIPELAKDASHETVIKTVLEKYKGIVIGENHAHPISKKFVIDNLQALKDSGVQTLFLEHVLSDEHQDDLDHYFGSEPGSAIPGKLRQYLEKQNRDQRCEDEQYNFFTLVEAAKEAGLKIVPIDCWASYSVHKSGASATTESSKTRYEVMNYLAAEKIKNRENDGKWIAFVGSGHANTHMDIPGVAELTGTLSVVVSDTKESSSNPSVRTNVKNYFDQIDHVDIVIEPK